uniref:Synapse defective Rho GTPase homolog 2 n=1 Tax=Gasterosteus aculeatus aculeatus TaxID=481459 RepID=A0AAQ4QE03_GASAC|nr:rho GTPase-activating protein SYDE2 [Gasterosteus aculeatus aculeatus]
MADPLRRTLLAKLRGKKSKKAATVGGYRSAAADGGREGKEKVSQTQVDAARAAVRLAGPDRAADRMSTYENCAGGAAVRAEAVVLVRRGPRGERASGARPQEPGSGGRVGVNEQLPGVSLQRDARFAVGGECARADGSHRGPGGPDERAPCARGIALAGPRVQGRHRAPEPWQCSVGDSIGFGGASNRAPHRAPVEPRAGLGKAPEDADGEATEPVGRRRMAGCAAAAAGGGRNANRSGDDNQTSGTNSLVRAELAHPSCSEENSVIRSVESYGPECAGDPRGPAGGLQSPTFFPTELEICDLNVAPLCATQGPPRYTSDSEDEDYYDNEILPFYETIRAKGDGDGDAAEQPRLDGDNEQLDVSSSSQETDRLRNRLKEAYYLLINAMNDINLDVQQVSGGLTEQGATSSCSSHSRDSLCSRLSAKNMDSDSWSSGGDNSPQQVSDTDSLLLCLSGGPESGLRGRLTSKSMVTLSLTERRPALRRSASDGAVRRAGGPSLCIQNPKGLDTSADKGATEAKDAAWVEASGAGEPSESPVLCNANGSDELLRDAGGGEDRGGRLDESSGSADSLTGSSDSNADAPTNRGQANHREPTDVRAQGARSVNKGHGVTVNKMQEWMHRGRLLSSEMKQRIEGSSSPRGGGRSQDRPCPQGNLGMSKAGVQTSNRGVKSVKAKSPQQQQPAFIENVQTSCANGREVGRASESSPRRPPLTTITVSKKRNWLQQSSLGKNHCTKDELLGMLGAEEEGSHQPPTPPSPSPDHLRPSARPACLQLPQITVVPAKVSPHPRSVDPAEENDADDEGEIWYNPIPEDDELETSRRPSVRLRVPPGAESHRRPSRGGDADRGGRSLGGGGGAGPEPPGESLGGGSGDGSQGHAAHSTEALQPHRPTLACKPQEEGGPSTSKATDCADLPNAVSSPPSSPNPAKKSSSINWSFPDKIKSPRTVRKLSMKMKKLPELSRKLSIKGNPSSGNGSSGHGSGHPEPRAPSLRNHARGLEVVPYSSGPPRLAASGGGQASRNVISRYHLDSSVSTQHSFSKKKSSGGSKSASKGGYLSDGDSPELVAKSGKHGSAEAKAGRGKETDGGGGSSKVNGTELDIDAFRHYSFTEQPKCSQYISGLMSLHFYGAEDLKPPRVDSRDVYCAIQVDSVNKARTALLTCRTAFLDMDHTFNIELENAQHLKLVVFSWEPMPRRNRVCCHGTVVLPALFRVTRCHQLAVKLEPRGMIYVKLGLMEQWQNSLDGGPGGDREPRVFGVEAWRVVERENTGLMVPLLISKCINEIEKRGCQVVGLYRLCGSAAVKKELREAFERDSSAVELCENTYPDVNVITGVLKDYLRELPYPLITKHLYEAVLESMATRPLRIGAGACENDQADSEHTVRLLDNLPDVERMTLQKLLDHLKLVASCQEVNKMTCQNLAVCFGPVLLSQRQDASCHTNRVFIDSEELASALHFKKHIEVLHYLLQLWPVVDPHGRSSSQPPVAYLAPAAHDLLSAPPLRRRKERPQVLNLSEAEMAGVLRPKPGRLDSPSNRYAGDWSGCGESYFPCETLLPPNNEEADYDDVPCEDTEAAEEVQARPEEAEKDDGQMIMSPAPDPAVQEQPQREELVKDEENEEDDEEEEEVEEAEEEKKQVKSNPTSGGLLEDKGEESMCEHILPPCLPKEHTYQAYMKIQEISPVLSNRVNLRDLQESIDTLIGNLERELNKNTLNVGY